MANPQDIAWAAGLFEGEGSLGFRRGYQARMGMVDRDVVQRFANIMGWKLYGPYKTDGQECFIASTSNFEQVQAAMAMFWPWLGTRRRAKVREVLTAYVATGRRPRGAYVSK